MKYIGIDCSTIVYIISSLIITFSKIKINVNTIDSLFSTENLKSFHHIEQYFLFLCKLLFRGFSMCTIFPSNIYLGSTPGVSKRNIAKQHFAFSNPIVVCT